MECFGFMGGAESRRRELANFEVAAKPRKKSGSASSKQGSKKAGATSRTANSRKTASDGTSGRSNASNGRMKNQSNARKRTSIDDNPLAHRNSHALAMEQPSRRSSRDRYDEFDRYDRLPRRPANGKKRRRRKKKGGFSGVSALLLVVILCLCGVGYWRVQEYRELSRMKEVVSRQTFFEGTMVDGIDLSQMTLQQALDYFNTQVEPAHRQATVVLDNGTQVTAEQLGYSSNYADVLAGAWSSGRTGSLVERYNRIQETMRTSSIHQVSRIPYDDQLVRQYAAQVAQQVDQPAKNASLKAFNLETYAFEFEPEQVGYTLNQESLVASIENALSSGGGNISMVIATVEPEVTQANVSSQYGMISYAVTNASSSSSNRLSNIRQSLSAINGMWLDPGESFSFNEVVGQRTAERGYKMAAAYASGKVVEELGGGICQVSTTLFNAVVKANLKINERHPHSMTVSYVDLGKDAAVDWGNKDLKFTNNSDDRIYICCYLTNDKRVRFGIFGKLLPNGMSITVEGVKTGTVDYKTEYQMSFFMASGQKKVIQKGKKGYKATAYKIWWDANGNELKREELCKSTYQSTPEIIEYGP